MKKNFKIKPDKRPPNVYIDQKYLDRIEEDIERCYPMLRRSDFINNILKSYYENTAGWAKIDETMSKETKKDKEPRQSFK